MFYSRINNIILKYFIFIFFVIFKIHSNDSIDNNDGNYIIMQMDKKLNRNSKLEYILSFKERNIIKEEYKMVVYAKDNNQKIIVRFLAPPSYIGNDLLMIQKNVWRYEMNAGRIMKIPSNLSFGNTDFSYGDVVRLNLTDNYNATILSEDDLKWKLDLISKERTAPYYRIEMEILKKGYIPINGVCFGKNNKIIKTIEYGNVKIINNVEKPTVISVKSPVQKDRISIMELLNEDLKEYPDIIFNKQNLEIRMEETM